LSQQGQQVEGNALGIFAHDAAGVCSGGVEVAQKSTVPLGAARALLLCILALSLDVGADQFFNSILCVSVRVGGAQWAVFGNGNHALEACGIAVDGGRGREDNVGDIVAGHGLQKGDGTADVDAPVLERDLARLADSLQGGKVDDIVNVGVVGENLVEGLFIGYVNIVEVGSLAADGLDAVDDLLGRVVEIVDNDDLVVGLEQGEGGKSTNVSSATVASISAWRGTLAHRGAYPVTRTDPTGILVCVCACNCLGVTGDRRVTRE
jgi:hypothetical protein